MNDSCESINSVSSDCSVITLSTVSPSESSDEESVYFHENQMLSIIEANIKNSTWVAFMIIIYNITKGAIFDIIFSLSLNLRHEVHNRVFD